MATSPRDVKLGISVETSGEDRVGKLRDTILSLAKQGGASADDIKSLADQLDRLGAQDDAIAAFRALSTASADLAQRQQETASAAADASAKLAAQGAVVQEAVASQRQIAAALDEARVASRATRDQLAELAATTDRAGKAEESYQKQVTDLKLAKIAQRQEIERLAAALGESNKAVSQAEAAEKRLQQASSAAAKSSDAAARAAEQHQAAMREAATAAEALGLSTEDLAASQAQVAQGFTQVETAASNLGNRLAALAAREEEIAGIRAFEQSVQDAAALQRAAEYADLFDEALRRLAASELAAAAAQAEIQWQKEANEIVEAAEAAQRLARQTEVLAAAEKELAAQRAFEKQASDAANLLKAAEYVQFWETELQKSEVAAREAADAAEQASRRIANAFSTVGVRSVQELETEIAEVRAAMATLQGTAGVTGGALQQAFVAGNARIKELERDIRETTGQLTLADRAADLFKNSMGQIAAGNVIADGIGYLVNKIKELGREFIEVTVQTERMRKGLQAIYKDTNVAGQQFDFLRSTANAAGVSISSINDAFLRFNAATKSANIPLSVTNELFANVTRAGATLGLTGEQVTGTLDALGQMASKGVVAMEELRQQLGDRLPGALSLAAQGLGITDQKLIKLVESGQLATEDFFPAFAASLKSMAGDTDTLSGAWQRFTNVLNSGAVAIGDAGGLDVLKGALQTLIVLFGTVAVPLQGFVEFIGLAGRGLGLFVAALTTGDFKGAFAEFGSEIEKSGQRIARFHGTLDEAIGKQAEQTRVVEQNSAALARNATGVLQLAVSNERLAAGTTATGNAYIQQLVRLAENAKATDAAITASEKLLHAKQDEGKALTLTAQLTGDQAKALDANATAATANVAASEAIVAARQREVTNTQAAITAINGQRDATGQLSSAKQQQLDKLNQSLVVQDAELEKARQTTLELGRQALSAQAAADAYADNSTKLLSYQQAMENARVVAALLTDQVTKQTAALAELKDQLETGKITQKFYDEQKQKLLDTTDALNKATGDAAKFENLFRDAVADSVAAIDRKARAASASVSVTLAQANAEQKHYEALARAASLQGNEAQATEFRVLAKMKEIDAIRLSVQIKNLELDADQKGIEVQLASLDPQDKLYQQKKQELEIRLQIIKAKRIEADASKDLIDGINEEIKALQRRANAQSQGQGFNVIDGANQLGDQQRPSNERQQFGSGQRNAGAPPAGGGSPERNRDGSLAGTFTNLTPFDKANDVLQNGGKGKDIDFLRQAKKQADDGKAWLDAMARSGGAGSIDPSAWQSVMSLQAATNRALSGALHVRDAERQQSAVPQPAPAAQAGGKPLTINLNGRATTVNVAGDQDAKNLLGVLRELENGKGTSS